MRFLSFLFLIFALVLIAGCKTQNNAELDTVKDATGDSVSQELNINTIEEASIQQEEIASADSQIDEVSSLLSDW
jgi:uncharacterized lipoprotein YajG